MPARFSALYQAAVLSCTMRSPLNAQYKTDVAYCKSGQASEARSLCLKEAAAAQADRELQRGAHRKSRHQASHKESTESTAAHKSKSASTR